jgi:hypothetical protein
MVIESGGLRACSRSARPNDRGEGRGTRGAVCEHRAALIYMLRQAAELEHGIMSQYLFAALALKQSTEEGLSETSLPLSRADGLCSTSAHRRCCTWRCYRSVRMRCATSCS